MRETKRDSLREPPAGAADAAAEHLAKGLARRGGPVRRQAVEGLRELGALDRAIYSAVAATPTPALDEPLRRLSNAANNSGLWLATAAGLAGLAITIGLLSMIEVGQHLFGSIPIGQSIAFTAFALCLIVAAVECRSETGTALTTATFDSKQMNWAILGESVLAVLVTQMDVFNRLLGTTQLNLRQFGWSLIPALALLLLWELGKYVARRQGADHLDAGDKTG